jgi:hypothetical protein
MIFIYMFIFGVAFKLHDKDANTFLSFTVYPFFVPLFFIMRFCIDAVSHSL